jgi:GNAT superfamily N-acetyltransferase
VEFAVRPARADDAGSARAVVAAVFDEYGFQLEAEGYDTDLRDLAGHYLDAGHRFWVAEDGDTVIGTVGLLLPAAPIPGPRAAVVDAGGKRRVGGSDCSLERLYVHPGGRRGGIGGALMRAAIDEARAWERGLMEIWSDKRFGPAHRLYERFGARTVGERIADDPDRSAEWGLALDL